MRRNVVNTVSMVVSMDTIRIVKRTQESACMDVDLVTMETCVIIGVFHPVLDPVNERRAIAPRVVTTASMGQIVNWRVLRTVCLSLVVTSEFVTWLENVNWVANKVSLGTFVILLVTKTAIEVHATGLVIVLLAVSMVSWAKPAMFHVMGNAQTSAATTVKIPCVILLHLNVP